MATNPSAQGDGVVDVNPPRGTRDFLPEDMRLRTWLFDQFREVSRLMAFEEVDYRTMLAV
jgi:histidyl-tRNA synthetase